MIYNLLWRRYGSNNQEKLWNQCGNFDALLTKLTSPVHPSPLRYPGGKRKVANYIKLLFKSNDLLDGHYVEPYAGGAGVALSLLFEEYASHVHINDIDPAVHAFWHSVLHETRSLCQLVRNVELTIDEWHRQRSVLFSLEASTLARGFSAFFLNRVNRSGIITGGVIGGQKQAGKWKMDARFNRASLIKRIEKVARYRQRITLHNLDAADFIESTLAKIPRCALVYLDPPYYLKSQRLYANYYEPKDHDALANLVGKIEQPWIVSYDYTPEIMSLYQRYDSTIYSLNYSAQNRYSGSEVMFYSPKLLHPKVDNPSKVTAQTLKLQQPRLAI